jgi:hypothetical protein
MIAFNPSKTPLRRIYLEKHTEFCWKLIARLPLHQHQKRGMLQAARCRLLKTTPE